MDLICLLLIAPGLIEADPLAGRIVSYAASRVGDRVGDGQCTGLVDEALAVGDLHFQGKCIERIEGFRRQGKTLLLVSHDMDLVRRFARRAILLEHGRVAADGPAEDVTRAYEQSRRAADAETGEVRA